MVYQLLEYGAFEMINDLPLKSDKVSIISSIINADFNFDNPSSPCQIRHPNDL